jgi:hypothetical protein
VAGAERSGAFDTVVDIIVSSRCIYDLWLWVLRLRWRRRWSRLRQETDR